VNAINYTTFRKKLSATIDQVNRDHSPILVTRHNGSPAVIMSLEDFKSYEETAYLICSPKNAERLTQAIEQLEAGEAVERELVEE
jgi:antitoxin YefM